MLPCYAGQAAKKASDTIKQFAQPPAPAVDSKWYAMMENEDEDELILAYYLGTFWSNLK